MIICLLLEGKGDRDEDITEESDGLKKETRRDREREHGCEGSYCQVNGEGGREEDGGQTMVANNGLKEEDSDRRDGEKNGGREEVVMNGCEDEGDRTNGTRKDKVVRIERKRERREEVEGGSVQTLSCRDGDYEWLKMSRQIMLDVGKSKVNGGNSGRFIKFYYSTEIKRV